MVVVAWTDSPSQERYGTHAARSYRVAHLRMKKIAFNSPLLGRSDNVVVSVN